MNQISELEAAADSLEQVIRAMSEREGEERKKLSERYTPQDEKEARSYDQGFVDGYEAGKQNGFAEGFDEGLKQAKKEEEQEGDCVRYSSQKLSLALSVVKVSNCGVKQIIQDGFALIWMVRQRMNVRKRRNSQSNHHQQQL